MPRRHAPDRAALALAIGVHGALLLLFLFVRESAPPRSAPPPALTVFDVIPPPPPPPPPAPPVPSRSRPRTPSGGAPPAASPPPRPVDATPQPLAPPEVVAVSSPFADDLGAAQLGSRSEGSGRGGAGTGIGIGIGNGSGAGPPHYAAAEWIRRPDLTQMLRYWPPEAQRRRIAGSVELACIVPRPGRPKRCWVLAERPRGVGFGRAAVAMSYLFAIRPVLRDGDVFDTPVVVPVIFNVAPARSGTPAMP